MSAYQYVQSFMENLLEPIGLDNYLKQTEIAWIVDDMKSEDWRLTDPSVEDRLFTTDELFEAVHQFIQDLNNEEAHLSHLL